MGMTPEKARRASIARTMPRPEMKLGSWYVDDSGILWRCTRKEESYEAPGKFTWKLSGGGGTVGASVDPDSHEIKTAQNSGTFLVQEVEFFLPEVTELLNSI